MGDVVGLDVGIVWRGGYLFFGRHVGFLCALGEVVVGVWDVVCLFCFGINHSLFLLGLEHRVL